MQQLLRWQLAALLIFCASTANADSVNLNVHIGEEPQQVIVVREPAHHHHHDFYPEDDIQFIFPGSLGFYVAVGLPYDLFFVGNSYYLFQDGYWHRAHHSQGPWVIVNHRDLPYGLRKHKIERLRHYRDREYGVYRRDEHNYRGKHFRSNKEDWQKERGEKNREGKDERREHRENKHHR